MIKWIFSPRRSKQQVSVRVNREQLEKVEVYVTYVVVAVLMYMLYSRAATNSYFQWQLISCFLD